MAERTVIWKAIADFSSIARQAAIARRELDRLEKKEQSYNQNRATMAQQQSGVNKRLAESYRELNTAIGNSAKNMKELADGQGRLNKSASSSTAILDAQNKRLKANDDAMNRLVSSVGGYAQAMERGRGHNIKFNQSLMAVERVSKEAFKEIRDGADATRASMSSLRQEQERSASSAQRMHTSNASSVRQSTSANRDLDASLGDVNRQLNQHIEDLKKSSNQHRQFHTDVDKSELAISKLKGALASLAAGSPVASVLSRLNSQLTSINTSSRSSASSWGLFQSVMQNFQGDKALNVLTGIATKLSTMGSVAVIASDGLGALSGGLAALAVGATSAVMALTPIIGLLGMIPGATVAAVGGIGSLIGSLSGVGKAMKAYDAQQKALSKSTSATGGATQQTARKIASAERQMAAARRSSAKAITDAERGIRDARERSARVQIDTARSIQQAEAGIVAAKRNVVQAERSVEQAHLGVNRAREDAVRTLRDLQRSVRDYALQEEGASLSLEESRKRLTEVMNDPGSTDLQRRQANLAVREAQARLEEVREASAENDKKLAEAQAKGIEGSDQVRSALEAEQNAQESLQAAKAGVTEAEYNLARAKEDGARAVRDANEAVVRSEQALADAHANAADSIEKANEAMEAAAVGSTAAANAANEYANALAELTPEARAVVEQLISMREGWTAVRKEAERAIMPGLLIFLQSVESMFPTITKFVGEAGREVGLFFEQLGRMGTSDSAMDTWNIVLADSVNILRDVRVFLLDIAQVLGNVARAAAESGLNKWFGEIVTGWSNAWKVMTSGEEGQKRLRDAFQKTMERAELFGSIISGLTGFFYNTGKAGEEAGVTILTSFDNALKKFNEWATNMDEGTGGFHAIKALADASVPVFQQLGELLVAMARGMGELAKSSDAGEFLKMLRVDLGPVLMTILKQLGETNIIETFVQALVKIGKSITETGLLRLLGELVTNIFEMSAEAIPALTPAISFLIKVFDGLVRALTWVFRQMNEGNLVVQGLVSAFIGLSVLAAFGILIVKLKNLIGFYRDGFKGLGELISGFGKKLMGMGEDAAKAVGEVRKHGFVDAIKEGLQGSDGVVGHFRGFLEKMTDAARDYGAKIEKHLGANIPMNLSSKLERTTDNLSFASKYKSNTTNAPDRSTSSKVPSWYGAPTVPARETGHPKTIVRNWGKEMQDEVDKIKLTIPADLLGADKGVTRRSATSFIDDWEAAAGGAFKSVKLEISPDILNSTRAKSAAKKDGEAVGEAAGEGLEKGLKDSKREVGRAAEDLAEEIVDETNDELETNSPSKVAIRIGRWFGKGLADGVEDSEKDVTKAGDGLADALEGSTKNGAKGRLGGILGGFRNAIPGIASVARGAAVAIGAASTAVGVFAVNAIQVNDVYQQHLRKSGKVFGEFSGEMEDWAKRTANSMFMTQAETLEVSNNFGTLFTSMGFTQERSKELAQDMTLLAAGLAAANPGVEVPEAFDALRDALEGDYTALSRLNPALNASAIEQEALRVTGKNTTDELTEQEKQAALLRLAHGRLGEATADLAAKQETASGKVEGLRKKWEDLKRVIGERFENKLADLAADIEVPGTAMYNVSESLKNLLTQENIDTWVNATVDLADALVSLTSATTKALTLLQGDKKPKNFGLFEVGGETEVDKRAREIAYEKGLRNHKGRVFGEDFRFALKPKQREEEAEIIAQARREIEAEGGDLTEFDRRRRETLEKRKKNAWTQKERDQVEAELAATSGHQDPRAQARIADVKRAQEEKRKREAAMFAPENYANSGGGWDSTASTGMPTKEEAFEDGKEVGTATVDGFREGIGTMDVLKILGPFGWIIQAVKRLFGIASPAREFITIGAEIINGLVQGIANTGQDIWNKIKQPFVDAWNAIVDFFEIRSPSKKGDSAGAEIINGLVQGIINTGTDIWNKIKAPFEAAWNAIIDFFEIRSPSKKGDTAGSEIINGLVQGILNTGTDIWNKIKAPFEAAWNGIVDFFEIRSPSKKGDTAGSEIINGLVQGILNTGQDIWNKIKAPFEAAWNAIVNFFEIQSPSKKTDRAGGDVVQGFINGINRLGPAAESAVRTLVSNLGALWDGIREATRRPVEFVVNTVYNQGIVPMWNAVAGTVGLTPLNTINFGGSAGARSTGRGAVPLASGGRVPEREGWDTGGWTGPGHKMLPAGIVHADEFVVRKVARNRFERNHPGVLDHINRTGSLPSTANYKGYRDGGLVRSAAPEGASSIRLGEGYGSNGFMGGTIPAEMVPFFLGGSVPAPARQRTSQHGSGYSFARWAGDLPAPMGSPVVAWKAGQVASTARWDRSYGWHIWVNHQGGERSLYAHLSRIDVTPGQQVVAGQRLGAIGSTGNSTGPHLHFEVRGGNSPINMSDTSGGGVMAYVMSAFGDIQNLITNPLGTIKGSFGDSPFTDAISKMPARMAESAKKFLDEKLAAIGDMFGAPGGEGAPAGVGFRTGQVGRVPGLAGVTANTYAKAANIYAAALAAGHRISTVGGYRGDGEHVTRRALDFMVSNKAAGDFISGYVWSNRVRLGLQHVIWWQRIISSARADQGWRQMANRGSWTQNHMDHPHVLFSGADRGFSSGGWTGPGHKMKPAGIVHADEFVVSKSSRRRFEREHPGALDHINRTGQLPGYHAGGIVKTGGTDGAWWTKGTTAKTNKWLGALRHFLGLDDWWKGWDDDLHNALQGYNGREAYHVWGPWREIIDGLRRLPRSEFTSVPNVASKLGIHADSIFRMMETNMPAFQRDLGDSGKVAALQGSFQQFRDFHAESIRELQEVLGVEVTGVWTEAMRQMVVHLKDHVFGNSHSDASRTGGDWSTVGSWGAAFDEVHRTIQLNTEWDRIIEHFYQLGYDSLIRHFNDQGVSQGMELARDLYRVPQMARDADVWYRAFYEREDAIKDQNSELNRLRRLTSYLRRYDNVGLQGLASELGLSMDTTAMLYRKAKDRDMLAGLGGSKISRMDKDLIDFDKLFRFALGGLVPGSGNLDSVMALLTPGEYVLTKDQTKQMFAAQSMFANYRAPSMVGGVSNGMAGINAGQVKIVNNDVTNNVQATIISPDAPLAGVAFQNHMKKLDADGLFGLGVNNGGA